MPRENGPDLKAFATKLMPADLWPAMATWLPVSGLMFHYRAPLIVHRSFTVNRWLSAVIIMRSSLHTRHGGEDNDDGRGNRSSSSRLNPQRNGLRKSRSTFKFTFSCGFTFISATLSPLYIAHFHYCPSSLRLHRFKGLKKYNTHLRV